ncbi:hypothetical protein ACWEN6_19835 [Sphaerisporangium sp. NPDC004334]
METAEPLDRAACADALKPHMAELDECFRRAWKRWVKWLGNLEGSPADIHPRTRANIVYDFVVAEGKARFLGVEGVRIRQQRGFLVIHFNDRIALRFKKFRNRSLKTSGINTKQAMLFDAQTLELDIKLQPMTHLVAGYLLDELALDINKLAVTCIMNGKHFWAPIEIIAAPVGAKVGAMPTRTGTLKSKVRSARKKKKAGDEE